MDQRRLPQLFTAMYTTAKSLILLAILFCCLPSRAVVNAVRVDPLPSFTTQGTYPGTSYPPMLLVPFSKVVLCGYPANGFPCTNFATSYTSATAAAACPSGSPVVLNGGSACQSTTDANGKFGFWVAPGNYSYMLINPITNQQMGPFNFSAGGGTGGGSAPSVAQILSGDGGGGILGMPEKGNTVVIGTPNTAKVAWNEDNGLGLFDARDTKYGNGGILGSNPPQAMQDLANDIICYQAITGLHAHVVFPPGQFQIGLSSAPTLNLPAGAYYTSAEPSFAAVGTVFQAKYSNQLGLHIALNLTATCSDGNVHKSTLGGGVVEGIAENGCEEGGCVNVPGDSGSYPNGGPNQDGFFIEESQGYIDRVGASFNGGNGVHVGGLDNEVGKIFANSNIGWYTFGKNVAGQTYNPTTDGWHCNVLVDGLDNHSNGEIETYGWNGSFVHPGAEYGHVCEVLSAGGDTSLGPVFINRGNGMGIVRAYANGAGRIVGGRVDAVGGEGIYVAGGGNTFTAIQNTTACTGFGGITPGKIFGPYIATLGSGMTDGTYVVPAVNATGDPSGAGATLSVVVVGGVANSISVSNPGTAPYFETPTFTLTGTGGTPATVGATAYIHCDYLENVGGGGFNHYVNVINGYDAFFGANNATGYIWDQGGQSTYDSASGSFEKINGFANIPKGASSHQTTLDPFNPNGGVGITGPAVSFTGGTHFNPSDSSPVSYTGPFVIDNIMQDLWIQGGNANVTLPYQFFNSCSLHDTNLGNYQGWLHFYVFRDNNFGVPFLFKEQCDTTFVDWLEVGFNYLASTGTLPITNTLATFDVAGTIKVVAYPPLPNPTITTAGAGSSFNYCFVDEIWVGGGIQTSGSVCITKAPVVPTGSNNLQIHQAMPQNWTRYQVRLNTTTDPSTTPGVWYDTTSPNGLPQPATADFGGAYPSGLFIQPFIPTDTSIISVANLGLNITGTYNVDFTNLPASSNTLCVKGQALKIDATIGGGWEYLCDQNNHWVRSAKNWATF